MSSGYFLLVRSRSLGYGWRRGMNAKIQFSCPACGQEYSADPDRDGSEVTCTKCNQGFTVSVQSAQPPPAPNPFDNYIEPKENTASRQAEFENINGSAKGIDLLSNILFVIVALALVGCLCASPLEWGHAPACIAAGAFSLAVILKFLAQLVYIRARLHGIQAELEKK